MLQKQGHPMVPSFLAIQRLEDDGGADFCMVVTDLTDIVAANLLTSDLEARVEERTKALVAKNQELEGFTYSVSHDLRTPLRAIVANAAMVLEEESALVSEEGNLRPQNLSEAALKMAQLVDDLLQYSRLGVRQLQKTPTDLAKLAATVLKGIEVDGAEFDLRVTLPPETKVAADARILGMALHNLFDNAAKYHEPGKHAVVELGIEMRYGERVFFIRDEGIGFDMAYVHKLFIPFERLHRDSHYKGTGIGLANVKRAIERHGGLVWAEGSPGRGSKFSFTLPDNEPAHLEAPTRGIW